MEKLNPEILDSKTYAYFTDEMALKHTESEEGSVKCQFRAATNERDFSEVIDKIREQDPTELSFMGVIGGVDMILNYLTNLPFDRAFMFDIDDKPIAYLGLRLCLLGDVNNSFEYYLNTLCIGDKEKEVFWNAQSHDELMKMIREYQPDPERVGKQGEDFMKKLGYVKGNMTVDEIFLDTDFRKRAVIEIIKYVRSMRHDWTEHYSWFFGENLKKLKKSFFVEGAGGLDLSNKIRAFKADFYNKFRGAAEELIEGYGIKNLVLYISNIAEIESRRSKEHTQRSVPEIVEPLAKKLDRLWLVYSKRSDTTNKVVEYK